MVILEKFIRNLIRESLCMVLSLIEEVLDSALGLLLVLYAGVPVVLRQTCNARDGSHASELSPLSSSPLYSTLLRSCSEFPLELALL